MRILAIVITSLILLLAVMVLPQLPYTVDTTEEHTTAVLDIWHIETSEGGSGSRRAWLNKTLGRIEREHTGLYINIYTYTVEQMITRLEQGDSCDLVSFGMGAGQYLVGNLQRYTGKVNCMANLLDSCCIDSVPYAVPYMAGIYGLFGRQSDLDRLGVSDIVSSALHCSYDKTVGKNSVHMYSVQCGFTLANNPMQALLASGVSGSVDGIDYTVTQYMAYDNFVSNRYATLLLGTQRDVFRVANRVSQGRLDSIVYSPLPYTDLVQYIGIMDTDNISLCTEIVQYLTSDTVQYSLDSIGMLSTTSIQPYSSNVWLLDSQLLLATATTASVYCDSVTISNNRQTALDQLSHNHE